MTARSSSNLANPKKVNPHHDAQAKASPKGLQETHLSLKKVPI
jgi:hypothetical protein